MRIQVHNLINKIIDIIFWLCTIIALWFTAQIFVLTSFKIPSDSMEAQLTAGDNILVWKPTIGPRIFNLFASMRNEQTNIYRIPGIKKIQRNDILVFNFPHPNSWDKIEMHILKYYIKRCVGLPGDTLSIQNGFFHVKGIETSLGNMESQNKIATTEQFEDGIFHSFPFDSIISWNIKDFGPLYIPGKGDSITLNQTNCRLYKKLIEWEQQGSLQYKDSTIFLNGTPINGYRFQKNYYFMAGDNGMNSQDSRYWGLLPEEYIVGKAWIIWKSVDPYTDKFRWNRFLKVIH
ncbi:signal peptidase I [Parabacteroides goldsteinii]|jgi:signal peptidase I|uniref:signal peptidase I n=1 Tax=Parabacteroides goldsteinii TaxID=328812 RepID=UPI001D45AED1|nr:signal peptidase I [Parabacteroides goldsteinii]MBS6575612.1 signal peptidase I [Parabacteroides goldsteinii]